MWISVLLSWNFLMQVAGTSSHFNIIEGCEHIVVPVERSIFTQSEVTLISCGILCLHDVKCNSIFYRPIDRLCTGSDVTTKYGCANLTRDPTVLYFEELCFNGGQQNATGQCSCIGGWIGTRCERIMKNCMEGVPYGYKHNEYLVHPSTAPEPFKIRCYRTQFSILRRTITTTLSENFNRSFQDYKDGFGDKYVDMWLGLDKIHYLTQDLPYVLSSYVYVQNGTRYRSRQAGFRIGNESTGYKMTFEYSVKNWENDTLGNCLEELNGQPFSTYDNDNDNATDRNCAAEYHGGYWFNACSSCNPTGEITRPTSGLLDNVTGEIFWRENLGHVAPYKIWQILSPWNQRINQLIN